MTPEPLQPPIPMFIKDVIAQFHRHHISEDPPNSRRSLEVEVCGLVSSVDERTSRFECVGDIERPTYTSQRIIDVQDGTGVLRLREWAPTGVTLESTSWRPPVSMGDVIIAFGPLSHGKDDSLYMKPQRIIPVESVLREVYWMSRTIHLHKHVFPAFKESSDASGLCHFLPNSIRPCRNWLAIAHHLSASFDINDVRVALRKFNPSISESSAKMTSDGWIARGLVYADGQNMFHKVDGNVCGSEWTILHDHVYAVLRDQSEPVEYRYVCQSVMDVFHFRLAPSLVQSILLHICAIHRGRMRYSPDQRFFQYLP